MPLRCITNAGDSLLSFDLSPIDWKQLREDNAAQGHLLMTCCEAPVVLKTSRNGLQFFAHKHQGDCTTSLESLQHLALKRLAVSVIRKCGWDVQTEVPGVTPDGEQWIADVLAIKGRSKVAVEIQWSPQTDEQTRSRQERYKRSGVRGLWLLHQPNFPVELKVPAACVMEDGDGGFTAMLPRDSSWGRRARSRSEDWGQKLPVQDILRAAFEGRFWYGHIRPDTLVNLKVNGGFVKCWACSEWTNLVFSLEMWPADGSSEVADLQLSDIPDDLVPVLIPNSLRAWKVGPIKRRYSKTDGGSYISNGCVNCDALQGRFFNTEIMHRLKVITEYTVRVTDRLAETIVEHHGARWRVSG